MPAPDALSIWHAGVDAVRGDRLLERSLQFRDRRFIVEDYEFEIPPGGRIEVVGAGKAAAAMAAGLRAAYDAGSGDRPPIQGHVNIPDRTQRDVPGITLHVGRPAGRNEPTAAAVAGTETILSRIAQLTPEDLCIVLISGGGSALLTAPAEGISLDDLTQVTRLLSGAGANIGQLNTVRKQLSRVKGGKLADACNAGRLITLIISDVLGDPLDTIASGPTQPDTTNRQDALNVLKQFDPQQTLPASIYGLLETPQPARSLRARDSTTIILANNAAAIDAAGIAAERLGYNHAMHAATDCEGPAEQVGVHLAEMAIAMVQAAPHAPDPDCLITGGEPVVELIAREQRGRGGRNQQLVLAAMQHLDRNPRVTPEQCDAIVLLSGGTDGEDGPTDAAGAILNRDVWQRYRASSLSIEDHLRRNDAYTFFQEIGGLIQTGPTQTNVCDLRVVTVARKK